jgi:hypothetical protein
MPCIPLIEWERMIGLGPKRMIIVDEIVNKASNE